MKTIKAKERTDKYGLKHLTYKDGRKTVAEISYPNEWNNHVFRATYSGGCFCFDNRDFEHLKNNVEKTLNSIYFGPVNIVYL